jgi:hypothetical protein
MRWSSSHTYHRKSSRVLIGVGGCGVIALGVGGLGKRQQPASHFLKIKKMEFEKLNPSQRFSNKRKENDLRPVCIS